MMRPSWGLWKRGCDQARDKNKEDFTVPADGITHHTYKMSLGRPDTEGLR